MSSVVGRTIALGVAGGKRRSQVARWALEVSSVVVQESDAIRLVMLWAWGAEALCGAAEPDRRDLRKCAFSCGCRMQG